ncbi:MAG TPA: AAA family ATPase [Rhodopila sp.]|nr:AAA family ATPase [Rhodopila sp.]
MKPGSVGDVMVELAGEILVLTGPPGAGKTTTADALARMAGSPKVHLHADDFWHVIKHGGVAPYLPEAHQQNGVVAGILARAAEGYATGGYFVVVDGIIGPWFLGPFRALGVPLHYIVLRPLLDVAVRRCRERGGDTLTASGPIAALHRQFSTLGELERHVLRTEGFGPEETLRETIKAVCGGTFRLLSGVGGG